MDCSWVEIDRHEVLKYLIDTKAEVACADFSSGRLFGLSDEKFQDVLEVIAEKEARFFVNNYYIEAYSDTSEVE